MTCALSTCLALPQGSSNSKTPKTTTRPAVSPGQPSAPDCSKSWSEGFAAADQLLSGVFVAKKNGRVPISIVVEKDFEGSDAVEFMSAEIIKDYFGDFFVVDTSSPLHLYLTGTKEFYANGPQGMTLQIYASSTYHITFEYGKRVSVPATIAFVEDGWTISGSREYKEKSLREKIYSALSRFRKSVDVPTS
jgi:hypothetical protein